MTPFVVDASVVIVSRRNFSIALSTGITVVVLARWVHAELPEMRVVAATDVLLPDGSAAEAKRFSTATNGDSAYLASDSNDRDSLVHEIDKQPYSVLQTGAPSPSGDGTILELGTFAMSPERLLFQAKTSNQATLLLTHDITGIRSAFEDWDPNLDLDDFDLEATNARGDALLRHQQLYNSDLLGLTLVLDGPEGVGVPIPVVRDGDPIPSVPGSVFDLSSGGAAYLADDGQVVFQSLFGGSTVPGFGVFFLPGDASTIEQVLVPFPGQLDGTETCCNLVGADDDGVIGIVGRRPYFDYLFVGKPPQLSLVLTVPLEGLPIPNAPEYQLQNLEMSDAAVGRGGDLVWTAQLRPVGIGGLAKAVLTYESEVGLRAVAIEGMPAPEGGTFPASITSLAANGRGGFQFTANETVYRSARTDDVITLERLGGPTDYFESADGTTVIAREVDSHLDSRAFEAGRTVLTVRYSHPETGDDSTMTLVDGTPLPPPPESCHCRADVEAGDADSGLWPLGLLGLSLLGRSRRRGSP